MKIKNGKEIEYKNWYDSNLDPYGHACFTYAERWAELLEKKIENEANAQEIIIKYAEETSHEADTEALQDLCME